MRHYIIVKYVDEVTEAKKQELIGPITELFNHLYEIKGIHKVEVCPNVIDRSNRYDLMIEIEMDKETLPVYDDCAWHHKWKDEYGKYVAKKTIFDR